MIQPMQQNTKPSMYVFMNTSERSLFLNSKAKILQLVPNYSVPRYTSYPTAPNFNEKINSDIYESWLKKLDKKKKFHSIFISHFVIHYVIFVDAIPA